MLLKRLKCFFLKAALLLSLIAVFGLPSALAQDYGSGSGRTFGKNPFGDPPRPPVRPNPPQGMRDRYDWQKPKEGWFKKHLPKDDSDPDGIYEKPLFPGFAESEPQPVDPPKGFYEQDQYQDQPQQDFAQPQSDYGQVDGEESKQEEDDVEYAEWKKLEDLVIKIRPQEEVLYPTLGKFVLAAYAYLLLFIIAVVFWIRRIYRRRKIPKDERPKKRLWLKLVLAGLAVLSVGLVWVVYEEWSVWEVFPAPYEYSADQQQILEHYGRPDSFSIFFGSDEGGYYSRFETWYYYEYEQSFVFQDGVYQTFDDVEPLGADYVPSPYEPAEFTPFMSRQFIWRWLGMRFEGDMGYPNPQLDLKETLPEMFEGYDLRLRYYAQLAVGFDDEVDRLIYVDTKIMVDQEEEAEEEQDYLEEEDEEEEL